MKVVKCTYCLGWCGGGHALPYPGFDTVCTSWNSYSYSTLIFADDADFNATAIEVTFDGDNSTLPVSVEILDDFLAEGTEAFSIRLGLPSGPNAGRIMTGLNQSVVIIEDNDGIKN